MNHSPMNIVYISPHFPPNYRFFPHHLKAMGANVLGIADAPYEQLHPELKHSLTEYYRVDNMEDYDQLLRACGYFTHIYGKIDRVTSQNEYWLETEARLRTDFNIHGVKMHQIAAITRKSEMKKRFQGAGVPVARGKIFKNLEGARELAKEAGYPLVFKPDRGVGAADTFSVRNDNELTAAVSRMPPVKYIMEEFIDGTIYSFDGLTDRDGKIVFRTGHVFSQGIMETVNEDRDIFYYSLREIPPALESAGRKAIRSFDIREGFFHLEFFRTSPDRFVALELNARPPGGMTMDMFNFANNIDLYQQWADVMVNNRFSAAYSRPYHCGYIGRKFNKNYLHSHRDIMQKYGFMIVYYGPVESVFSAALGNYAYIANAPTLDELEEAAIFIQESE